MSSPCSACLFIYTVFFAGEMPELSTLWFLCRPSCSCQLQTYVSVDSLQREWIEAYYQVRDGKGANYWAYKVWTFDPNGAFLSCTKQNKFWTCFVLYNWRRSYWGWHSLLFLFAQNAITIKNLPPLPVCNVLNLCTRDVLELYFAEIEFGGFSKNFQTTKFQTLRVEL